jgi:hypothetical protein
MFAVLTTKEGIIIPLMIIVFLLMLGFYLYITHQFFFDPKKRERIENDKLINEINKSFSGSFKWKN